MIITIYIKVEIKAGQKEKGPESPFSFCPA
jgi:hypothetical protein